MASVPFPHELPGEFFVLEWNADAESFTLYADDEAQNSYRVGNIQQAMLTFKILQMEDFGNRCIDQAREFGRVQAIRSQNRIINLFDRRPAKTALFSEDSSYASLPAL